jgi:hypothetical protein
MSIELDGSLAMFMAREANRRSQDLTQRAQAAQMQSAQQAAQQATAPGSASSSTQGGSAATGAGTDARLEAAGERNECACRAWGDFKQDAVGGAADASTTVSEAQRQSIYSNDGTAAAATAPTSAPGERQSATNQDLINRYYREGGGTWAGASKVARAEGRTLSDLVKDRRALATPSAAQSGPSTSGATGSGATHGSGATPPNQEAVPRSGASAGARAGGAQRASATTTTSTTTSTTTTGATTGATVPSGAPLSGSAFGNQVAAAAERSARRLNSVGACALGVNNALTSVGVAGRGHAYQKAEQLARHPRFREVDVGANQLSKLPAGAVVVWGRSAEKPWGHVSVALGDGREASDHISRQITGGRYGTDFGNGRDPQGRQFRVFVPN